MKYTALVPVKSLDKAKTRLADHLTQTQRASLMLDMLQHVICVLRASNIFEHVAVVSPDIHVLECAQLWGAHAHIEEVMGHNPALTAAATHERDAGTSVLLTISADLPLLHKDDIYAMIVQSMHHPIVLAASQDGTGTNALLTRPPLILPYLFGPGSLQHYRAEATQRKLSSTIVTRIGLSLDIDTIDDLNTLRQHNTTGLSRSPAECL